MFKDQKNISKILIAILLVLSLYGFWYFESSVFLRILILGFAGVGIYLSFFKNIPEKSSFSTSREFLIILILYLVLFSLYNLLYGFAIPISIIMIFVLALGCFLFYGQLILDGIDVLTQKPILQTLVILVGLVVLEVFLSLSFWPVDPKIKSLIIVAS